MANLIEVKDLKKKFGDFEAVQGISFSVEHGKTFGFLGPNGAGKSTTIKMLTTLLQPPSCSILIDGNEVEPCYATERGAYDLARAGEGPSLIEAMTSRQGGRSRPGRGRYRPQEEVDARFRRDANSRDRHRLVQQRHDDAALRHPAVALKTWRERDLRAHRITAVGLEAQVKALDAERTAGEAASVIDRPHRAHFLARRGEADGSGLP